ncbi:tetratricopeptide repeat protein [Candidatus Pelagibacter sp.]|jgi:tetratricopeptide (TPR) repeat protein|nr:tetratricopeptide repeat protein [Candidatus Pelagibacter sp.]MDC1078097.1 tetratricopeptide repeat protein [Candidatus Pelagibacter sp.]
MNKSLIAQNIKKNYQLLDNRQYGLAEQNAFNLLKQDPNNHEIYNLIGDIHYKQNNFDKSLWYYFSSLDRNFDPKALNRLGTNIFLLNNNAVAEKVLTNLLAHDPKYVAGYLSLGLVYEQSKKLDKAIDCYKAAIKIDPKEIKAYLSLAALYKQDQNYEGAIKVYQQGMINNPSNHFILSNLGNLFYLQHKYEDAIISHQRAIKAKPDSHVVHFNFANTLLNAGKYSEAIEMYKKTIALNPRFNRSKINLGTTLLSMSNFEEGFKEYFHRIYEDKNFKSVLHKKNLLWNGQNIENKKILIVAEEGLGNTLQFSRYLETLSQLKCKIIFQCQEELHHLFEDMDFIDQLVSIESDYDDYDYWAPLQNLINILTPDLNSNCPFPSALKINDNKLLEWETLIAVNDNVKIGLNWQGSASNPRVTNNSVSLERFKNVLNNPSATFISLQKGSAVSDIEKFQFEENIINYDLLMDTGSKKFLDTAAIIKYLDLVITTDTAIAHLAGTLGTQTWLLLPKVSDWRWLNSKDETIWYDNFRIYRQKVQGDWSDVFSRVEKDSQELIKNITELRQS